MESTPLAAYCGPARIWQIHLDGRDAAADRQLLSKEELASADRLAFDLDRGRYLAAHAQLRHVLARQLGCEPGALRFASGSHGKPMLDPPSEFRFNLSHSQGRALIGLSSGPEIGIDLEQLREIPHAADLAARVFTLRECDDWSRVPAGRQMHSFLSGWTRKEACLKAIGSGLSVDPQVFDAGLDATARTVHLQAPGWPGRVAVRSLDLGPGWIGAIAWVL
jgi:4'-phosphopantetheinyl transferase